MSRNKSEGLIPAMTTDRRSIVDSECIYNNYYSEWHNFVIRYALDNKMNDHKTEWVRTKQKLIEAISDLGFPSELGEQIAKQLGSPKAMTRMIAYLEYVKPNSAEMIVDEMLAICSDLDRWRKKKECEEANIVYNEMLNDRNDEEE